MQLSLLKWIVSSSTSMAVMATIDWGNVGAVMFVGCVVPLAVWIYGRLTRAVERSYNKGLADAKAAKEQQDLKEQTKEIVTSVDGVKREVMVLRRELAGHKQKMTMAIAAIVKTATDHEAKDDQRHLENKTRLDGIEKELKK